MYTLVIVNKNYSSWSLRPWVLMRTLRSSGELLAGVSREGVVTVEGQVVGRLQGVV